MAKMMYLTTCGLVLLVLSACSQPVLKQDIPVTTNPMGARIYANGQLVGATPASVSLERNRDHILTLAKDNYRQEDVVISRKYQKERVYLKAIQSGVSSGLFFKDAAMGMGSSMGSLSSQENSGEAYVLVPPAVKVTLTPLDGTASGQPARQTGNDGLQPQQGNADDASLNKKDMARGLLAIGASAAAAIVKPIEKNREVSSSSSSYVKPDGTKVTEKSSTSVGVSFNPVGLVNVLDTLFK